MLNTRSIEQRRGRGCPPRSPNRATTSDTDLTLRMAPIAGSFLMQLGIHWPTLTGYGPAKNTCFQWGGRSNLNRKWSLDTASQKRRQGMKPGKKAQYDGRGKTLDHLRVTFPTVPSSSEVHSHLLRIGEKRWRS